MLRKNASGLKDPMIRPYSAPATPGEEGGGGKRERVLAGDADPDCPRGRPTPARGP